MRSLLFPRDRNLLGIILSNEVFLFQSNNGQDTRERCLKAPLMENIPIRLIKFSTG